MLGDLIECPCGCTVIGKEQRTGHARGCSCRPCIGRRNRRKGHAGQAKMHRALGGVGFTPHDEESGRTYSVEVQVEAKVGDQIPRTFVAFSETDWLRRALSQAERAIPAGVQAFPAVYCQPSGGGRWLIVKL